MKKVFIFLLIACMLILPLVSCTENIQDESSAADESGNSETSQDAGELFPLEQKKFDKELLILCRTKRSAQQFYPIEEFEGSVINQAVQTRNEFIEEQFGITINIEQVSTPGNDIKEIIESNLDTYDLVCDSLCRMLPAVTDNYYYSLNDWIALDKPWWDQNANSYLSLSDKIFFVTGDALFMDDFYTTGVLYNKAEYEKHFAEKYGSIYEIVRKGDWTYDTIWEMAKAYSQPDENGAWGNIDCHYGIVTDGYTGASQLVTGAGVLTVSKDEMGNLTTHVGDEQSVKAFDKVYNLMKDTSATLYVEELTADTKWGDISNMFLSQKALFYITGVNALLSIKDSDLVDKVDPGILPIPKYDKAQDDYHNGVNIYQCEVLGMPITNVAKREATIYLLEALGYYSSNYSPFKEKSVTYSTYDTTLKLQSVTADDDSEMMDKILNNRLYDLGAIFDWTGQMTGVYSFCLYGGANNLVSKWDGMRESVELAIAETVKAYQDSIA